MPHSIPHQIEPVRVLHVIASLGFGGAENALLRLVRKSVGLGLCHTVVSLTRGGALAGEMRAAGAAVFELPSGSWMTRLLGLLRFRTEGIEPPDIIQGWMVHGNLVAWLLRAFKFPRASVAWNLRATLIDNVHEKKRTIGLTHQAARLSKSVDLLIANSATSLREHQAAGYRPRRSIVIPNGFDPDVFHPDNADRRKIRDVWGVPNDALVFGLIGRLHPVKGHDIFVQAAAKILVRHPRTRFVLVGTDIDTSSELDRLLADRTVSDAFIRLGTRSDIPSIMRGLDVVCVPSYYESFPNVLGEAMMCACPAIATDVSDVTEIMGGIGRIIPVGDINALVAAMGAMIEVGENGRRTMGTAGRARMIERYSLSRMVNLYDEQYRLLSGNTHSAP